MTNLHHFDLHQGVLINIHASSVVNGVSGHFPFTYTYIIRYVSNYIPSCGTTQYLPFFFPQCIVHTFSQLLDHSNFCPVHCYSGVHPSPPRYSHLINHGIQILSPHTLPYPSLLPSPIPSHHNTSHQQTISIRRETFST